MKSLFRNKKGSDGDAYVATEKPFKHITFIIVVSGVLILFLSFGTSYMDSTVHVSEDMKAELLMQRMQNVCLASTNPATGAVQENVLNYHALNRDALESCFSEENTPLMVVNLKPLENNPGDFSEKTIKLGRGRTENEYVRYTIVDVDGTRYPAQLMVRT